MPRQPEPTEPLRVLLFRQTILFRSMSQQVVRKFAVPWVESPAYDVDVRLPVSRRFANAPLEILQRAQCLLAALRQAFPSRFRFLADLTRLRTLNRFHAEAVALARLVGTTWREVVIANLCYDLTLSAMGCSTVALPTPSGPVLARNMDFWPEDVLAQTSCLVRYQRDGRLQWANAGWPGAIGVVTGLSGRGFAVALNAVLCPEAFCKTGYPVLLQIRRVLEDAANFESALKRLTETRLTAPALLTLVGSENDQRVVIERTPRRHALRWARRDDALVATNDYRILYKPQTSELAEIYQTTCQRYNYLEWCFRNHRPQQEMQAAKLLYVLTDENVRQGITAQHIIMWPRTGTIQMLVPRTLVEPQLKQDAGGPR